MEVPIKVAVRLRLPVDNNSANWLTTDPVSHNVITNEGQLFKVDNALPMECSQYQLYSSIIPVQLNCILNGCDTSVVVMGQRNTGKTYSLLGPNVETFEDVEERGIIPRFIHDVFERLGEYPERSYIIHITWMRLVNGKVIDLLGCGLAKCNNVKEALQLLSRGRALSCEDPSHTVFILTVEQRWIAAGGVLHHKLSTASFCELAAYPEPSLHSLEDVIKSLLQPIDNKVVNYEQSLLTAMLRDSFGGRAFTWILCCLSPDVRHQEESLKNLQLCWCCRGIKNFVTVNGYADNNTKIINEKNSLNRGAEEIFGLQFAAQQWIKLVANAEGLFHKLLQSNTLSETEVTEINEWLFLKAECDDCLTSNIHEMNSNNDIDNDLAINKQTLPCISEDTEPSELSDIHSDSDTSIEHDQFLFNDKLYKYIEYFEEKTDELILDRCEEYFNCRDKGECNESDDNSCLSDVTSSVTADRRKTIQPGENLSQSELELLRRVAAKAISPESQKIIVESKKNHQDPESRLVQRELLKVIDSPVPSENVKKYKSLLQKYNLKQSLVNKLSKEIQDNESQLKELTSLCAAKEQLILDLTKMVKKQGHVKRWSEKQGNVKMEYDKAKSDLIAAQTKYIVSNGDAKANQQIRKCKSLLDHYERRVKEMEKIDLGSRKDIKKHELNLKTYRKQIEQINKYIKRDEKRKNTLQIELIKDKSKLDEMYGLVVRGVESKGKTKKDSALKQVTERITHLDNMLKEKSNDLQKHQLSEEKEQMLRNEIRNLRRTKECLIDKRCSLGHKRKTHKSLSDSEERKLLECEEAIEAIDTAIEYKNALICGRGQNKDVIGVEQHRERGEEMLMARLSKLSDVEMRTLLYRYFQKVIDLRSTCASLEAANVTSQREVADWRRRCADAWTTLHHTRIMHHRRTTTLTARHIHTLNQLMRDVGNESDTDALYGGGNNAIPHTQPLSLEYYQDSHLSEDTDSEAFTTQHRIAATTAKINLKDNSALPNANFLNEIQRFTQYHQSSIPSQNLKQLQPARCSPLTKVTRQKNKLVIVQQDKPTV